MVEKFRGQQPNNGESKRVGPYLQSGRKELLEWALQGEAWNDLPKRERMVLEMRYREDKPYPLTQVEIAAQTGMKQPNVSFAENNAFRKLGERKSLQEVQSDLR